ncbi:hypothetical protein JOY44_03645 [Phormidium sp. CLA17]|uniref:hypothetical protein n=1 Tax=Leptolyngbya sp. Cla-17 TaxID=2803751 RepID=UPI0014925CA6|nr:hypothetical protein [Leptolyngbya sp. Cla-17]MBM0740719.1 hypothetical protein [Leptolyngbya sp. Cla-17]
MKESTQTLALIGLAIAAQAAIIGAVVYVKFTSRTAMASQTAMENQTGFVKAAMPDGAIANEVLIVGPDCDRPEGIRKKALAAGLAKLNVPHHQTSSISMNSESTDDIFTAMTQMDSLMKADSPVVFVNAKGKANPTLDEVVAEYRLAVPQ